MVVGYLFYDINYFEVTFIDEYLYIYTWYEYIYIYVEPVFQYRGGGM